MPENFMLDALGIDKSLEKKSDFSDDYVSKKCNDEF